MSVHRIPNRARGQIACDRCGFAATYCLCSHLAKIEVSAAFALLTHQKEFAKETNTGFLMQETLSDCQTYCWQRLSPPVELLQRIKDPDVQPWLLFPPTQEEDWVKVKTYEKGRSKKDLFIIVDATWQQAAKIVRKSPWLTDVPRLFLNPPKASAYVLRKNQQERRVCTVEVGVLLLDLLQENAKARQLEGYFDFFTQRFIAYKRRTNPAF